MTAAADQTSYQKRPYTFWHEYLRPWKLATYALGLGLLVVGSFHYEAPDWDIPISIIMSFFTYLTAGWSMQVILERRWRQWPAMIFATWWAVDGCYALYWSLTNPEALELMREANWPASLALYWMCGLLWFWNGTLQELYEALKRRLRR